jgi:hypothetical protein
VSKDLTEIETWCSGATGIILTSFEIWHYVF